MKSILEPRRNPRLFIMLSYKNLRLHHFLYLVAILGIIFYAIAPVAFPDAAGLRQPELLPVYCAMLGLGQVLKGNLQITTGGKNDSATAKDNVSDSTS